MRICSSIPIRFVGVTVETPAGVAHTPKEFGGRRTLEGIEGRLGPSKPKESGS